jgi:hypothetical protein
MEQEMETQVAYQTLLLTLEAEKEECRVNNLSTSNKTMYIAKSICGYIYYEWYCYYLSKNEYLKYKVMKNIYRRMKRLNKIEK